MICVEVGVDRIIILQRERETVPQSEGEYMFIWVSGRVAIFQR